MLHGVIPIDKPRGMTSHDVVFKMRKILGIKKVGHTGTLDPEVTGVLPICIGEGTKLTEYMQAKEKSYIARVTLGLSTDTEDQTGTVTGTSDVSELTDDDIDSVVTSFPSDYEQQVPMYSSVKVNGRKLYEYAREGETVERPRRTVKIYSLERVSEITRRDGLIHFDVEASCSKGTYMRTLAVDIGRGLDVHAHMSKLVRTSSCGISIDRAITLEDLQDMDHRKAVVPLLEILKDAPLVDIMDAEFLFRIQNGQKMPKSDIMDSVEDDEAEYVVFTHGGRPLGVYYPHPDKPGEMKPYQMFNIQEAMK
ncbi:tRNA pseudouridine(55) synthase TruB [Salinicoccus carnicancri]|uniref:tRNA pseudouridine(55) synthase TruB n=1 Tax=Salinicoccus carnicancri TaxID=558170 RepID=UPI0002FE0AA5|nr:tRNA pseudouridine(55) synthase TruB [Salinicoccus carnicancri]